MPAEVEALGRVRADLRGASPAGASRPAARAGWPICPAQARAYLDRLRGALGRAGALRERGDAPGPDHRGRGDHGQSDRPPRHRRGAVRARGRRSPRSRPGSPASLLDRRTIVSTIERYPLGMTFFSTPERIEIGGIPFIASHEKPTRRGRPDLLPPRRGALRARRPARARTSWTSRARPTAAFRVEVRRPHDETTYRAAAVVFATGYYDNPNYLRHPGRGPAARRPLLPRGAPLLASAGGGDRGGEQQRGRGARVLARGGDGDAGALRRGIRPHGQGLGAARHHQPGEGGQHRGALAVPGPRHHADRGRDRRPRPAGRWSASPPTRCSR